MQAQSAEASHAGVQNAVPPRLAYLPGVDGLRALAVIAVLLYHADLDTYGGYLGVESFFVISGFLITALLLHDWQGHGRVRLKAFWVRRARRLLPALFITLAGTLALTTILLPDELTGITRDTLAAIGYATNWHLIGSGQPYFDAVERPSLLRHLWSLAIEEQFYIVWPLVFAAGMRCLRARGLLLLTLFAAIASGALMAALYEPGADPSRIYYGTDTRAAALLLGGALALVWAPGRTPGIDRRGVGVALDALGLLALAGLIAAYAALHEDQPLLYRGGFGLVAIGTAIAVAATTHPRARVVPWLLERQPLRWVGLRSYGIYLWHWPIFMVTRPGVDIAYNGWQLQLIRFALAFGLAALSYTFVELPIRQGALGQVWGALRSRMRPRTSVEKTTSDVPIREVTRRDAKIRAVFARLGVSSWILDRRSSRLPALSPALSAPNTTLGQTWRLLRLRVPFGSRHTATETNRAPAQLSRLDSIARRPRAWYRRWAPAIATGVLALGTAYVTANVSQAAMQHTLIEASPRAATARRTPETSAANQADAAPTPDAAATSGPNPAHDMPVDSGAATLAQPHAGDPEVDSALADELQHILDETVEDGSIPGAVLSVRLPNGAIWTGASGLADRGASVPMQPETRVRVGSLSKMFTAVVVLQLVEEGAIDLDAPIATWLPGMVPKADIITVRELLQHRSGIYDYLEDRRFISQAYGEPDRVWKPQELVAYATRFPASFAPGAKDHWDYSNTNYVILGMIVEQATGHTLGQELRQRIFEPLNLRQTYVIPEETVDGPQAHGYAKGDDHTRVALSVAFGAANIVTTADDLRQFGLALFSGQLLDPATEELMQQFVGGKGKYNMPELGYGLGLMRNQLPVGPGPDGQPRPADVTRVIGHIGGFGGFRAALWYAPESGMLIALGVNQTSTDPNVLATQVFEAILQQQGR